MLTLAALTLLSLGFQQPPFEDEIVKFEAADRAKAPAEGGVLFVGSSSIRMWSSLAKDFPEYATINRGFGGSAISDSIRNVDRIVTPYKPRAIVFFAGTNDLASGKSPETVAADYRTFVERVRAKLPSVSIAFIAITPAPSRWSNIKNVRRANALVAEYAKATPGLWFVDTYPRMVNAIGGPRAELFGPDNLHMVAPGYAIWKEEVGRTLREMLK